MTQPDTKNDRELAEHAVCAKLLHTVAQGDQFLQGGTDFGMPAATFGPGA